MGLQAPATQNEASRCIGKPHGSKSSDSITTVYNNKRKPPTIEARPPALVTNVTRFHSEASIYWASDRTYASTELSMDSWPSAGNPGDNACWIRKVENWDHRNALHWNLESWHDAHGRRITASTDIYRLRTGQATCLRDPRG